MCHVSEAQVLQTVILELQAFARLLRIQVCPHLFFCFSVSSSTGEVLWLMADAPQNDLLLIHMLQQYERLDGAVARACLKTLSHHMWYLCEQTVPLALLDSAPAD